MSFSRPAKYRFHWCGGRSRAISRVTCATCFEAVGRNEQEAKTESGGGDSPSPAFADSARPRVARRHAATDRHRARDASDARGAVPHSERQYGTDAAGWRLVVG